MNYLEIDDIISLHNEILDNFWWLSWVKDEQQINSILQHIKNDTYYWNIVDKSTHLFFWLNKFHCFNDWNKRTSIWALWLFLQINNIDIPSFFIKMEDIAIWVAKNEISKIELSKIIKSILISFWYKI